jgi:low temperature requirement protein LtrA
MSTRNAASRPICSAVLGFLDVTLIALAFGLANEIGVIDADVSKRGIGFVIGCMIVIIGNYLPKLRAFRTGTNASSTATERIAGWMLVLTGILWIALFAVAPLNQARHAAAMIGMSALAIIAVNWAWHARRTFFSGRKAEQGTTVSYEQTAGKRKIVVYLLFAFFYVLVTSCVKFVFDEKQVADKLTSWMLVAFGMLYAALFSVLEYRHTRK